MEHPRERGTKVCINGPGHMTKMATCPYMVKTFINLHVEPPWDGGWGQKFMYGPGHLTKMAAMPIYGKNL